MTDHPHLRIVRPGDGAPSQPFTVDTFSLVMLDGINRIFHNGKQLTDLNALRAVFTQLLDRSPVQCQQPQIAETFTFIITPQKTLVQQNGRMIDEYLLFHELGAIVLHGNRLRQQQLENELASTPRGML